MSGIQGNDNAFTNRVGQSGNFSYKDIGGAQVRDVNIQRPATPRVFGRSQSVNLTAQQKNGSIYS